MVVGLVSEHLQGEAMMTRINRGASLPQLLVKENKQQELCEISLVLVGDD